MTTGFLIDFVVPKAANAYWNGTLDNALLDPVRRKRLVGLEWIGKPGARGIKRIWVRRTRAGKLQIAPSVSQEWEDALFTPPG